MSQSDIQWSLEKRKLKDLYDNPSNPRKLSKHQEKQLQNSLSKFGQCEPIVINPDGLIIGGHQRARTLKKLRRIEAFVFVPSRTLDQKEVEELTIRLNKNTGTWDFDSLANHWDPADLLEWGFSMEELHLESLPDGEDPQEGSSVPQGAMMTIKFKDVAHLQEAENRISVIVDEYQGATCKVRVK